ncbi:MAG: outer membrane beta-barrel protein [Bacteroidota bacterium]
MRNKLIILIFMLIPILNYAQDKVGINFAQNFTGFKFKDSQGNEDPNLNRVVKFSYAFDYLKTLSSGIYLRPELAYKNYGAESSVNNTNIEWNLNYLDINFGIGYIFNRHNLKPYFGLGFYYSYLFKANQIIGSESYDLISNRALSVNDFGINMNLGFIYDFSENNGLFLEFRNDIGLNQLDKNINGGSKELYNRASSIHFGLLFKITKKKS